MMKKMCELMLVKKYLKMVKLAKFQDSREIMGRL
jgi:hypothetical protein